MERDYEHKALVHKTPLSELVREARMCVMSAPIALVWSRENDDVVLTQRFKVIKC